MVEVLLSNGREIPDGRGALVVAGGGFYDLLTIVAVARSEDITLHGAGVSMVPSFHINILSIVGVNDILPPKLYMIRP